MENNFLDKIESGNNEVRELNIGGFEGVTGIGKVSNEDIRKFLCDAQKVIQGYLNSDSIKSAYGKAVKKYNGTSLKYRKVNPLPSEKDIIKEYYRQIPENLTEETIIYEFAKIAFWANKVTKMICLPAKRMIKANLPEDTFTKLQQYYEKVQQGDFETEKRLYEESDEFRKKFYEYSSVMRAEKINYFLKTVSIREMYSYLVKDNYTEFQTWGMYRDNKGNLVFAIDFPRRKRWNISISFRR